MIAENADPSIVNAVMDYYKGYSDNDLVILVKQGDQLAFGELYDRYWNCLYHHAIKLLRNEDDAQDVVQEVFTHIWSNSDKINLQLNFKAYLFTSVKNRVLNTIRSTNRQHYYIDQFTNYVDQHQDGVVEKIQLEELTLVIEQVIDALPERMRKTFELSRKENLSHREIAEEMKISELTVKRQISNALQVLRSRIDESGGILSVTLIICSTISTLIRIFYRHN